jgi:hypothetical protein
LRARRLERRLACFPVRLVLDEEAGGGNVGELVGCSVEEVGDVDVAVLAGGELIVSGVLPRGVLRIKG